MESREFMNKFGHWIEEGRVAASMLHGALGSMKTLNESIRTVQHDLKACAAVLAEQLLLKSSSLPVNEKDGICRKTEQWLAGAMFGLEESYIHPTLVKFAHTVHQA